ncbi:hypothetical protein [Paenibacillus sp. FSL L8-0638]|uniref:hypothetical protein n=1 Tax=Paenibacillus TaxID=44249 RepID=UPI000FB9E1CA
MKDNNTRQLRHDIDFLTAATISQTEVRAWQQLEHVGNGIVERITPDYVKLRSEDGSGAYYARVMTVFVRD